jgi:hypothetical protein
VKRAKHNQENGEMQKLLRSVESLLLLIRVVGMWEN